MITIKEEKVKALQERRRLTFCVDEELFQLAPPFPREITIDINNRCNHKCYFCANKKIAEFTAIETDLVFDLMRQGVENGCTDLALQATGEPFMDARLADFIKEGKRIGYEYIYINTNGALVTAEKAKPVLDAGLDSIKFSINAANREDYKMVHGHDDFDKVIKNLHWVFEYRNKNKLKCGVYVSFVRNSKSRINDENLKNLVEPFCDNFDYRDVSNQGGSMIELNESEAINKENILGSLKQDEFTSRCIYPFNRIVVNPYGYVVACTADFHNQLFIGDTRKATLKEIWMGDVFKYLRKKHLSGELSSLYCDKCLNNVQSEAMNLCEAFEENL